jgi:hypothetical protein
MTHPESPSAIVQLLCPRFGQVQLSPMRATWTPMMEKFGAALTTEPP